MSSVRIESCAFGDPRFDLLGSLLGVDRFSALGRMAFVWRYCTDRQTYIMPATAIDAAMGIRGAAAALVGADLAEEQPEGFRIKGTHTRIEWLGKLRANAPKGGAANKRRIESCASGSSSPIVGADTTESHPASHSATHPASHLGAITEPSPSPPSPSLTLSLSPEAKKEPPARSRARAAADPRVAPVVSRWIECWQEHYRKPYAGNPGAGGKAVKALPAGWTTERILAEVERFWSRPDDFMATNMGGRLEQWIRLRLGTTQTPATTRDRGMTAEDMARAAEGLDDGD